MSELNKNTSKSDIAERYQLQRLSKLDVSALDLLDANTNTVTSGLRRGANRPVLANGSHQRFHDDLHALGEYLGDLAGKTKDAYRRELVRFYLWSVMKRGKAVSDLDHDDVRAYIDFLLLPDMDFCARRGGKKQRWGNWNAGWRPFAGPLSPQSARQAMTAINNFFGWLQDHAYIAKNPVKRIVSLATAIQTRYSAIREARRSNDLDSVTGGREGPFATEKLDTSGAQATYHEATGVQMRPKKYIHTDLQGAMQASIMEMRRDSPRNRLLYERSRWMFTLFRMTAPRVAEVYHATSSDIQQDAESGLVWIGVTKGRKVTERPWSESLSEAYSRYRKAHGLPGFQVDEQRSVPFLIACEPGMTGPRYIDAERVAPLSVRSINEYLKFMANVAVDWVAVNAPELLPAAEKLNGLSTHWFRHTSITDLVRSGVDVGTAQAFAAHSSPTTTLAYYTEAQKVEQRKVVIDKLGVDWESKGSG